MTEKMKLHWSPKSPYVRKVMICAHELDVVHKLELVRSVAAMLKPNAAIMVDNPLSKIPTLVREDGSTLFDSIVICEYLNSLGDGSLVPRNETERLRVLTQQPPADGVMDAGVLTRYETFARPLALRWNDWITGQLAKVNSGLDALEGEVADFDTRVDLGTIAVACALGYLDFRFAKLGWRDARPNTAAWFEWFHGRDSMVATRPA